MQQIKFANRVKKHEAETEKTGHMWKTEDFA